MGKVVILFISIGIIPGLMEPKAGLFYIWIQMAQYFYQKGHSCLLFDLAGQGDNILPLSFDVWREQRNAILHHFSNYKVHFITRGLGAALLTSNQLHVALYPSLFSPVAEQITHIRWKKSPICSQFLTPAKPNAISKIEKECFYRLGAEAECIGGLQLPITFLEEITSVLPKSLTDNIICYDPADGHPLFDKQSQRDILFRKIDRDLNLSFS